MHADRIGRHRSCMQSSGQTTLVLFGNALDAGRRAKYPKIASARPNRNQMGSVLAEDQPVWRSSSINTLITGRTHHAPGRRLPAARFSLGLRLNLITAGLVFGLCPPQQ